MIWISMMLENYFVKILNSEMALTIRTLMKIGTRNMVSASLMARGYYRISPAPVVAVAVAAVETIPQNHLLLQVQEIGLKLKVQLMETG